jgi:hypothetical protein
MTLDLGVHIGGPKWGAILGVNIGVPNGVPNPVPNHGLWIFISSAIL